MPVVPSGGMSWGDFEPVTPEKNRVSVLSVQPLVY